MLITPGMAAYIVATDLFDLDPTEPNAEDGRRFSSSWGFDRRKTGMQLERLISDLDSAIEPKLRTHLAKKARQATRLPLTRFEYGLAEAAHRLVERVEVDQRTLSELRTLLLVQAELSTPLALIHD
ncbi:MAG: hypothetical protein ABIP03_09195 [Aquihabitans sp.]